MRHTLPGSAAGGQVHSWWFEISLSTLTAVGEYHTVHEEGQIWYLSPSQVNLRGLNQLEQDLYINDDRGILS